MLMDADDGGVDHLDSGIMGACQCVQNLGPNTDLSPTNKAIVAGRVRAVGVWHVAPWRSRSQDPEDAIKDPTVVHPRSAMRLVGQHGLMATHS